jgi:hypothetical protein
MVTRLEEKVFMLFTPGFNQVVSGTPKNQLTVSTVITYLTNQRVRV